MKKLVLVFFTLAALVLAGCSGDRGPVGPPGPEGPPGDGIIGTTFEYEGVTFDYEPDNNLYATIVEVPAEIQVFDSDAILVFRMEVDGNQETWSLIPQVFFVQNKGIITYVYNHTTTDIELLIDGDFDMSDLDPVFTDNQVFRFVVVPSEFANDPNVHIETFGDLLNYDVDLEEINM